MLRPDLTTAPKPWLTTVIEEKRPRWSIVSAWTSFCPGQEHLVAFMFCTSCSFLHQYYSGSQVLMDFIKFRRFFLPRRRFTFSDWSWFIVWQLNSVSTMSCVFVIPLLRVTTGYIWPLLTGVSYPQITAASSLRLTTARIRNMRAAEKSCSSWWNSSVFGRLS